MLPFYDMGPPSRLMIYVLYSLIFTEDVSAICHFRGIRWMAIFRRISRISAKMS
jgi:hypothetical protein